MVRIYYAAAGVATIQNKTLDMHKLYAHSFLSCAFILGKRMGLQELFEFMTGCSTYGLHLDNHIGVLSCDANELYFCIKKIWSKNYFLFWATEWTTAGFHQKHIVARQSQTYSSWSLCELQDKLKAPGIPKVYEQLNLLSLKICPVSAGGNCFYRQSLSDVGANEDCCSLLMKVDK